MDVSRWATNGMTTTSVILVLLFCQVLASDGGVVGRSYHCPLGWTAYNTDLPITCVTKGPGLMESMGEAHDKCVALNASLIVVNTEAKRLFLMEMMKLHPETQFWLGLQKKNNRLYWKTKDGSVDVAPTLPEAFSEYSSWYGDAYHRGEYGLLYQSTGYLRTRDTSRRRYYGTRTHSYICEKSPDCVRGYFGENCDKRCHCHGEYCATGDRRGFCRYGCQVGWMGQSCNETKEEASIKYSCVKKPGLGEYVHIRINTKGVKYDTITALDKYGEATHWCNSTEVRFNKASSVQTITISVDRQTTEDMASGACAGEVSNSSFSVQLKIQERNGFVSKNDQHVMLTCDEFSQIETLSVSAEAAIQEEEPEMKILVARREGVELAVVDPYTALPVNSAPAGTPVMLRIQYNRNEGDEAVGVRAYDCEAFSPDRLQVVKLLDQYGCILPGSIISSFYKNGTKSKSYVTDTFPLLRLPGAKTIEFHCSYVLCFDDDFCPDGCSRHEEWSMYGEGTPDAGRYRRSAGRPDADGKLISSVMAEDAPMIKILADTNSNN